MLGVVVVLSICCTTSSSYRCEVAAVPVSSFADLVVTGSVVVQVVVSFWYVAGLLLVVLVQFEVA